MTSTALARAAAEPHHEFRLAGRSLFACASGALWDPAERLLAVADLHLGRSERIARLGGALLPPYETEETLDRLGAEIERLRPRTVLCLGDSFDDQLAAESLSEQCRERLLRFGAGRRWIWVAGNHDPAPFELGGAHRAEEIRGGLVYRHIAASRPAESSGTEPISAEISGHYHPKAQVTLRGRMLRRPAFLVDARRAILPAFGAYTGGLDLRDKVFDALVGAEAQALLCSGGAVHAIARSAL